MLTKVINVVKTHRLINTTKVDLKIEINKKLEANLCIGENTLIYANYTTSIKVLP